MSRPVIEAILRQDRLIVLVALIGLVAVSWGYLWFMATGVQPDSMSRLMMPADSWNAQIAFAVFVMWAVMMAGMMLPSAAPMILLYAAILRKRPAPPPVLTYTWLFLSGYLAIWVVFSAIVTGLQWWLCGLKLVSPTMAVTNDVLNGGILIAAGIYQWLPFKAACLQHCRSPVMFITKHTRPGFSGAFVMGLHHGTYCIGCCWILMLLLFVGGIMNLLWIAFLAAFVLVEKLVPGGRRFGQIGGAIMLVAGAGLIFF